MQSKVVRLAKRGLDLRRLSIVFIALFLVSCVNTNVKQTTKAFTKPSSSQAILLMEPDVEMGLLTASGIVEPRVDWTNDARKNLVTAVQAQLNEKSHRFTPYNSTLDVSDREQQVLKLHETVGRSIISFGYTSQSPASLPTKKDVFDWSLGSGVRELNQKYGADYALFLYSNGSYSSGGRVAASIAMAVLFGSALPGGRQVAFASLVDLRTGDIVWFNVALTASHDPRKLPGAETLAKALLKDIPL